MWWTFTTLPCTTHNAIGEDAHLLYLCIYKYVLIIYILCTYMGKIISKMFYATDTLHLIVLQLKMFHVPNMYLYRIMVFLYIYTNIQIDRVLDAYFCRIKYSSVCINILAVHVRKFVVSTKSISVYRRHRRYIAVFSFSKSI